MAEIWARFSDLYGSSWESNYGLVGGDAFHTWHNALASFPVGKVEAGITALIEEGSDYPPNLVKFLRLCREFTKHPSHQTYVPALPKGKARYSVMRIETAKQQCLTEKHWSRPERRPNQIDDWTADDERKLVEIFKSFDVRHNGIPTHAELNKAIDFYGEFSSGVHAKNCGLKDLVEIDYPDGRIGYVEYEKEFVF